MLLHSKMVTSYNTVVSLDTDTVRCLKSFENIFTRAQVEASFQKSNLHFAREITQKRETNGGAYLRSLAPGQHRNVAMVASRWRQCLI